MRIDTLLLRNQYELSPHWHGQGQRELKESMISHMKETDDYKTFINKLATYSDMQFGKLCVRLANHQEK